MCLTSVTLKRTVYEDKLIKKIAQIQIEKHVKISDLETIGKDLDKAENDLNDICKIIHRTKKHMDKCKI